MPYSEFRFTKNCNCIFAQRVCFIFTCLLISILSFAQPVSGTNENFKKKVRGIIDKQESRLLSEVKTDRELNEFMFEPCRNDEEQDQKSKQQNGITKTTNNFIKELKPRIIDEIRLHYTKQDNYFDNKPEDYIIKYAEKLISANSWIKTLEGKLKLICNQPLPNNPPVARVKSPVTIRLPDDEVKLDGSNSYDKDKDLIIYSWQKVSSPPGSKDVLLFNNTAIATATALIQGTYTYLLIVRDTNYATDSAIVTVDVLEEILPPSVKAGPDKEIVFPADTVRLNGTATDSKNGGGIVSVVWTKLTGDASVHINSPNSLATTVSGLKTGIYTFRLTATNKAGRQGFDDVKITVNRKPNNNPVANAGADKHYPVSDNRFNLEGRGTDPDPGDVVTLYWQFLGNNNSLHIVSPESGTTAVENLAAGQYHFKLTATDQWRGKGYDTVVITIDTVPVKIPPVANAGSDGTIKADSTFLLNGSGSYDSDGTIVAYKWEKLDGPGRFNFVNNAAGETVVNGLDTGLYVFRLTVTDNDGLTGNDTMRLQVQPKAIPPPPVPVWPPPWFWWLLILIILAAGTSSWWFFFGWWNIKEKVIVYFLNKEEQELAHHFIPGNDKTDGYLLGHCTRGQIKRMRKKGLALEILNTKRLVVQTPGVTSIYQYSIIKGGFKLKKGYPKRERPGHSFINILPDKEATRSGNNELPAFYIITLDEPLQSANKEKLEAAGISIIRRIPKDSYILYIKDQDQLNKITPGTGFTFIRAAREYSAEDTGFTVLKEPSAQQKTLVLDVVLHREQDMEQVLSFLREHEVEIINARESTIRIRLQPGNLQPEILASNKYIQSIYEHLPIILCNDVAREMIGIEESGSHHLLFSETGEGEIIAIADTGIYSSHPDFAKENKIVAVSIGRPEGNVTIDTNGHGTHVAGTIAGDGTASGGAIKGMAPAASLFFQSLLTNEGKICDLEMQITGLLKMAYEKGARIINISWGAATEGYYTFDDEKIDSFVYEHQDMLVVISAGNKGNSVKDENGNPLPGVCTITSPGNNKNGLTVGASISKRNRGDDESVAAFSSRGPSRNDIRIKPDIVAPGTNILSAVSADADLSAYNDFYDAQKRYAFLDGTSMATPVVSGAAALVREFYRKKRNYPRPSAALIKATLLNGAKKLTGTSSMQGSTMVPNINQGYGMLNLLTSIPANENAFALWYCDSFSDSTLSFRKTKEEKNFRLTLKTNSWFSVCMVFVDKPGKGPLQNDIDLIVHQEGSSKKWIGNKGVVRSVISVLASQERDDRNNIEIIKEENAEAGEYIIETVAKSIVSEGDTAMALVITTGDTRSSFTRIQL